MSDGVAGTLYHGVQQAGNVLQRANGLVNTVNTVMDAILWPFVQPLIEIFEMCLGDPEQLQAKAQVWDSVAAELDRVADDVARQGQALAAGWKGEASTAAQRQLAEQEKDLREIGKRMREEARTLEQTAEMLAAYEDLLRDVIRELVEWLIVEWIVAQILAPETAGLSEVGFLGAAAPATSSLFAIRCLEILNELRKGLWYTRKYYHLWKEGSFAEKLAAKLIKKAVATPIGALTGLNHSVMGPFTTMAGDLMQYGVQVAAGEFDDRRSGVDGNDDPLRSRISEYVDPIADRADPYLDRAEETAEPYVRKVQETAEEYVTKVGETAERYLPR
ncbi:WXG100 family type VII secretion target [Actinoplanes teichomyceticus]|uniref:Uncharacterized protein YukE n=1 Tax=Actinoplanes teichomyceticus TaxID=1867 RepID=A0A561WIE7_ACTTI|nr:WXG100 family type VII secretion target [Actinoplanes teichomyceticus]TWG23633.1 uncharacterized protein YukE [Actinoplanes teichomyceticus]GIF11672.1 hypothetical protein Ate01nite_17040 [Actinoplanes teichomyceticus]